MIPTVLAQVLIACAYSTTTLSNYISILRILKGNVDNKISNKQTQFYNGGLKKFLALPR